MRRGARVPAERVPTAAAVSAAAVVVAVTVAVVAAVAGVGVSVMLVAGAVSALLGALFGAAWFAWSQGGSFGHVLRIWAASDFLGVLIVTPLGVVMWTSPGTAPPGELK